MPVCPGGPDCKPCGPGGGAPGNRKGDRKRWGGWRPIPQGAALRVGVGTHTGTLTRVRGPTPAHTRAGSHTAAPGRPVGSGRPLLVAVGVGCHPPHSLAWTRHTVGLWSGPAGSAGAGHSDPHHTPGRVGARSPHTPRARRKHRGGRPAWGSGMVPGWTLPRGPGGPQLLVAVPSLLSCGCSEGRCS